jgi:hypothetical protein
VSRYLSSRCHPSDDRCAEQYPRPFDIGCLQNRALAALSRRPGRKPILNPLLATATGGREHQNGRKPMPSFDVVSELNAHELTNAVDQANRVVSNRFDFKGTGAKFDLADFVITLEAPADFQLKQMMDILSQSISKRSIDVAAMAPEEPEIALNKARQKVVMRHGVDAGNARNIVKMIKEKKLKVQAAIQGEQVRVTGKKRDTLQEVIQMLKDADLGLPLQFTNFRD